VAAEKKSYTEEIVELKLAVAPIAEIKSDVKELVRAIKGNNGNIGLNARMVNVEKSLGDHDKIIAAMKDHCERNREDMNEMVGEKFDELIAKFEELDSDHKERLEKEKEIQEADKRDRKKQGRNFWYGLGLGIVPQALEWIVSSLIK